MAVNNSAGRRIFTNAMSCYARSVLSMFVGIFTGRWVLEALGAVDFGLFALVGTLIAFVSFLNTVLSYSVSRHLSFSVGQVRGAGGESYEDVQRWFNVAFLIHACVPLFLILAGYPVGVYVVKHVLTIPPERISTCVWVFRFSLVTAFVSMISVPYSALYAARQRIAEQSLYEIASSLLRCLLAYVLLYCPGDKLFVYSAYMTAISVVITLVYRIRCWMIFPESHLRLDYMFDQSRFKAVFSFALWNTLGVFGWMMKDQGLAVLANKFFGPIVNAAMGVAQQVSTQVNALSFSILRALSPEIISTEGEGDRERMKRLAMSASRFAALLSLFFALPLCFEMNYVIGLWLKSPPPWSILFCRIILIGSFYSSLAAGQEISIKANGKIAGTEVFASIILLLSLPIAWCGCKVGLDPWVIMTASSLVLGLRTVVHVFCARRVVGLSAWAWITSIFIPIHVLIAVVSCALYCMVVHMGSSFARLLLVCMTSSALILAISVLFVLNRNEKQFVLSRVMRIKG